MNTTPNSTEIYATLSGRIDQQCVQRLFNGFNVAINQKIETVHLLVHSTGGFIADGIATYNYLKAIPINLITYNVGLVASVAVVLYLAGKQRKASATANFMVHKAHHSPPPGTSAQHLKDIAQGLLADDARLESIFKNELTLSKTQWRTHARTDLFLNPDEARICGLIHAIDDWKPPSGTNIFTV